MAKRAWELSSVHRVWESADRVESQGRCASGLQLRWSLRSVVCNPLLSSVEQRSRIARYSVLGVRESREETLIWEFPPLCSSCAEWSDSREGHVP